MSDKRFILAYENGNEAIFENRKHFYPIRMTNKEVERKLNEQQDTIITLKGRLEKINGGYGHLTHRKGLTANEWLIQSQEKELKKKDDRISEWIEQHSKDIAKISEQNKLIQTLKEENKQLLYKLQQIEEYLQIKIDECKNHKKMEEIVFGVEQKVGYEKALLGFQKGLKRRLNDC